MVSAFIDDWLYNSFDSKKKKIVFLDYSYFEVLKIYLFCICG